MKPMAVLKEALCIASALKMLDVSNGAGQNVIGVVTILEVWRVILPQEYKTKDWHPCRYGSRLWNNAEESYHVGKQ